MAIAIREFLGNEGLQVDWNFNISNMTQVQEAVAPLANDSLMVDIEGIHVGATRNFTWYTKEALEGSVPTWTKPYLRPLIMHHNEKDGRIIGRIRVVAYTETNTKSNTGALLFTANVPDKEGKEQIQDGRLSTVSIGVIVHDARCSICGHNIAEDGPCEHERGVKYGDKVCYWMIYRMEAKELSYVIVPSDIYAQNVKIYKPSKSDLKENSEGVLNLSEATKPNVTEGEIVISETEPKTEPTPAPAQPAEPTVDVEALKADIKKLEDKVKEIESERDTAKADLEKAQTAAADAVKELNDTKVLLDQAQKSLQTTKDTLTAKESELATEKGLRESLENEAIENKKSVRENLIDSIITTRQALGKPVIGREELEKRSDESLKDNIADLKEEMNKPGDVTKITPAVNPSISENDKEILNGSVKEDKKLSNIDLTEGLENIMKSFMGPRR